MNSKIQGISSCFVNRTKTFQVVALFPETIRCEKYTLEARLKLILTDFCADKNEATTIS